MIALLEAILCVLQTMAAAIINLLVIVVNGAIVSLGALLSLILLLLPDMPEPPDSPSSGVLQFINFIVPVAPLVTMLLTMVSLFVGYLAVRVILNWVKAL